MSDVAAEQAQRWADQLRCSFSPDVLRTLAVACGAPTRSPDNRRRLPLPTLARRLAELLLEEGPEEIIPHLEPTDRELARQVLGHLATTLGPEDPFRGHWASLRQMPHPESPAEATTAPDAESPRMHILSGGLSCHPEPLEPPGVIRAHLREVAAQVEVTRMFDALRARKLWMPSHWRDTPERTLVRFAEQIEGPLFNKAQLRARAWPRLLSLLPMVEAVSKVSYALTEQGDRLKGWTPRQLLRLVLDAWLYHREYDSLESLQRVSQREEIAELNRITDAPLRRLKAVGALRLLPVGRWVDVARFLERAYTLDMLPQVAPQMVIWGYDPGRWMAYRLPPDDPRGPLHRLGAPYMLVVSLEIMATLGVLDVGVLLDGPGVLRSGRAHTEPAFPRAAFYDGLTHIRLTELGAWLLDPFNGVPEESGESKGGAGDLDALADLLI